MPDPRGGEAAALRIRRLELDLDGLRAEDARLKGSIAQRQEEIVWPGRHEAVLVSDIAEMEGGLTGQVLTWWPVQVALRRRPVPVNASRRSSGSDIAVSTVIDIARSLP